MNSKRVDAPLELVGKRRIDHAVAFKPGLSAERPRDDIEPEVRLAAWPMPGMSLVQVGFVLDVEALRRESRNEFGCYDVVHSHRQADSRREWIGDNKPLGVPARRADLSAVKS
jgi:hypothetical protein